MNNPLDPSLRELNECGCCEGLGAKTPKQILNAPALPAVRTRPGAHPDFKASLLAALSSRDRRQLLALRTREDNDFTIGLLDGFASMADVLTFYSERIANEAFLGTATERRSVLELARSIGYELAPGVAAEVMLSFEIEGGAGAPGFAIIPAGTKVQSIPGPGEKPQTFETSVDFTGRANWNKLRPRQRAAPPSYTQLQSEQQIFLAGINTNIRADDVLVVSDGSAAEAKRVFEVIVDREANHTLVKFQAVVPDPPAEQAPPATSPVQLVVQVAPTRLEVNQLFVERGVTHKQVYQLRKYRAWEIASVQLHLNRRPRIQRFRPANVDLGRAAEGVFILRSRAGFFGSTAPKFLSLPDDQRGDQKAYKENWDDLGPITGGQPTSAGGQTTIWTDSQGNFLSSDPASSVVLIERPIPEVTADSWIVLGGAVGNLRVLRIASAVEVSRADYGISGKCLSLDLKMVNANTAAPRDESYKNRTSTAFLQSEPLGVLGSPLLNRIDKGQTTLELDSVDMELAIGQFLALQGENNDLPGSDAKEIIQIADIRHVDVTILTLKRPLEHSYVRSTVSLNANVVVATHGETTNEALGNGDATQSFQKFVLKQKPLTYTLPRGSGELRSSLEVRVNEVKWAETRDFYGHGPKDRVYIVRRANDGTVTVEFGNGESGARLPGGHENVRAVYRKGIGEEGIVKPSQIKLLLTQPLGVNRVDNLLAPQGAQDPQDLEQARRNAPRTVLTLDRIVSLADYEDFARDFPGVAKAHATWAWSSHGRGVLISLLGPNGAVIAPSGPPAESLATALNLKGNAQVPLRIISRPPSRFALGGSVRVDPDRLPADVEAAVRAALMEAFSFEKRQFGQGAALGEVIAIIQNVPGVAFVDIDDSKFRKTALNLNTNTMEEGQPSEYLSAKLPDPGADLGKANAAEILLLDELSLDQLLFSNA